MAREAPQPTEDALMCAAPECVDFGMEHLEPEDKVRMAIARVEPRSFPARTKRAGSFSCDLENTASGKKALLG